MTEVFDARAVAETDRSLIVDAFKAKAQPEDKTFDNIFTELAKDPAKFNAVVTEMEKLNANSNDGLVVGDQKSVYGGIEAVKLEYHKSALDPSIFVGGNAGEIDTTTVSPAAAEARSKADLADYTAKEVAQQDDLSFYAGFKSIDELAKEVTAKVKLAIHDPHVISIGYSKTLWDSFRKLDPITFTLLADKLDRNNSWWSSDPQVTVFTGSNGFGPSLDFRAGTFDYARPVDIGEKYFGKPMPVEADNEDKKN